MLTQEKLPTATTDCDMAFLMVKSILHKEWERLQQKYSHSFPLYIVSLPSYIKWAVNNISDRDEKMEIDITVRQREAGIHIFVLNRVIADGSDAKPRYVSDGCIIDYDWLALQIRECRNHLPEFIDIMKFNLLHETGHIKANRELYESFPTFAEFCKWHAVNDGHMIDAIDAFADYDGDDVYGSNRAYCEHPVEKRADMAVGISTEDHLRLLKQLNDICEEDDVVDIPMTDEIVDDINRRSISDDPVVAKFSFRKGDEAAKAYVESKMK